MRPFEDGDDTVTDRVIAVVNNDAITLAELQESIALAGDPRTRQQQRDFADERAAAGFLNRLIEIRLQLQEAEREKILVDEVEVTEEFNDRIKRYGMKNEEEFEKARAGPGHHDRLDQEAPAGIPEGAQARPAQGGPAGLGH